VSAALEGRLHPLAVVVLARRVVGAGLLPVLVLVVSGGARVIVPLLVALAAVIAYAVLAWSRFRYRVGDGRLELRSGVLSRSVRTIPLDRVRGVVVTAPFVHRLLGLVRVEVEAAAGGGDKAELSLPAVSVGQADALRAILLEARPVEEGAREPTALYRARPGRLALGGVTSLSYLLAPAAVVGVVTNLADNLPGSVLERAGEAVADNVPTDPRGIGLLAVGAFALVLLLAAAGSLLVDWGFALLDDGERFTASRGLLTRRVVVLERARIRGADVRDTPLRRPLRLASVTAIAAGLRGRSGGTTLAPVLSVDEVAALLRAVDPAAPDPAAPLTPHPAGARRRRLLRALALPVAALVVALAAVAPWAIAVASLATVLAVPLALDRYRQLGHRFDGRRLAVREGSLRRRWSEVDPGAVVAFELRSSPGQRRAGLCTVAVHLGQGAGSRRALDLGEAQAASLLGVLNPPLLEPLARSGARD
jgi:putative membrane protein